MASRPSPTAVRIQLRMVSIHVLLGVDIHVILFVAAKRTLYIERIGVDGALWVNFKSQQVDNLADVNFGLAVHRRGCLLSFGA